MSEGVAARDAVAARDVVASMHVHRVHGFGVARALQHMATDRVAFRSMSGLRFVKSLGTSSGETFGVRDANLRQWATFAVWDAKEDYERFLDSRVSKQWETMADESWHALLEPLRVRGTWTGVNPFGSKPHDVVPALVVPALVVPDDVEPALVVPDGRVAAITRARIRPSQWRAFWKAVPPVAGSMATTPGLLYRIGIGEAPIGLQGTFSVWEDNDAIDMFAYRTAEHREVIRQTNLTNWYAEEMFARFTVVESRGTLDGQRF